MHAPRSRSLVAVAVTALLLVAGCSSSGGDDDATTTTADAATTTTPDDGSTTAPDDETTTTEGDDETPTDGPTREDLEGILPEAADVGDGWDEVASDGGDDAGDDEEDAALEEQCPEAAALGANDETDDAEKAVRSFEDAAGAGVEVKLNPTAEAIDADELDQLVDAINGCGPIAVDGGDGSTTTFEFEAVVDDEYGDQGLRMQAAVSLELPEVGVLELTLYFLTYRDGPVGVSISGADGLDEDTLETVPIDPEILVALADGIDADLAELTGG